MNPTSEPLHLIHILAINGEAVVSCATCKDEIGSSRLFIPLAEVNRCLNKHIHGEDFDR
jgi:hypothetical protein